jgi:hypothetical protein
LTFALHRDAVSRHVVGAKEKRMSIMDRFRKGNEKTGELREIVPVGR